MHFNTPPQTDNGLNDDSIGQIDNS